MAVTVTHYIERWKAGVGQIAIVAAGITVSAAATLATAGASVAAVAAKALSSGHHRSCSWLTCAVKATRVRG